MSCEISSANILSTRTRSGKRVECTGTGDSPSPSTGESKSVPVKSLAPSWQQSMGEYFSLAQSLYNRQLAYIKSPGEREKKYELMSEGTMLMEKIKVFTNDNRHLSKCIEEVQVWMELFCWNTRLSVFQQTIAVL